MSGEAIPFAAIAAEVARALLGEPNPTYSTRTEYRYGSRGSLAVHVGGERAGTWRDHEAAQGGGILALVARETGLHNGAAVDWLRAHGFVEPEAVKPGRRIVATYDYTDASGAFLFQVVRYDPKDFRQRARDETGAWVPSVKGIERVLYRLPAIAAAPAGAPIYIVEGEKSADALAGLGLIATCSPGGAGKWAANFSAHLAAREVIILPDNDPPGAAHAAQVAASLQGVATSVRVLTLPNLPPKGDVCDWLAAGGDAATLAALAGVAPPAAIVEDAAPPPPDPDDSAYWQSVENDPHMSAAEWHDLEQRETGQTPSASPEARAKAGPDLLWSITDPWDEAAIPQRPWVARGYLMRRSLTVLSGPGSAGKSSLMVAWAVAAAIGSAFHHFHPDAPLRVATYNVEDDAEEQKRRFSAILRHMGLKPDALADRLAILGPSRVGTLLQTARDGSLLVNTPVMDALETFIDAFRPDILILDPFVELHAAEENDNTAVRAVLAKFRAIAIAYDCAVVILHHARKGNGSPGDPDTMRGASSIVGAARVALTLNVMTEADAELFRIPPDKRRDYFRLDGAKNNYAPIEDAEWFQRIEIALDNGDGVAIAWPWKPPSVFKDTTPTGINAVLDTIAKGPEPGVKYAGTRQGGASRWAGPVLVAALGVTDRQAHAMLKEWLKTGLLYEVEYQDPWRKPAKGIMVDDAKRPS